MSAAAVQLDVHSAGGGARVHLIVRLVLLCALGALGYSSLYWVLYLAVPALVALQVSSQGAAHYVEVDAPRIVRALGWVASAYAYLFLLTDEAPAARAVELRADVSGRPTPGAALMRLLYSLPALIVLAILTAIGGPLWIIGALAILFAARVPGFVRGYFQLVLEYQLRLCAYHLSLVERYPSLGHAPQQLRAA